MMRKVLLVAGVVGALVVSACATTVSPIVDAKSNMKLVKTVANGKLYQIDSENVTLPVMHLWGSPAQLGRAHGELLGADLVTFIETALPKFIKSEITNQLPKLHLPAWLEKIIAAAGEALGPPIVDALLTMIYSSEQKYNEAGAEDIKSELQAMAEGACSVVVAAGGACDSSKLNSELQRLNVLPELIKMQCSMLGAWGKATPDGGLRQMRTLDFGSGPWANHSIITIIHPAAGTGNTFASVAFPGFVGSVTGFSTHVGLSEKVWDVAHQSGNQPGSNDGEADAIIIRRMLQFANTAADAVKIAQAAKRTWAVFLGVGDTTGDFKVMGYRQQDLTAYDAVSLPGLTNQTSFADVAYVDKHPQPSGDHVLPMLLQQLHGSLSGEVIAQTIPRATQSGDVHLAVYDFAGQKAWVAVGRTNEAGDFDDGGYAWQRPLVAFSMTDLWSEPAPTMLE